MLARMNDFLLKYSTLPDQGTKEWTDLREGGFGASDLPSLLGVNPYKSAKVSIAEKTGLEAKPDYRDPNFMWGHFWEPIHRNLIKIKLETEIYEASSIPYEDTGIKSRYRNSPDGVFTIHRDVLIREFGNDLPELEYDEDGYTVGILELKAPAQRKLKGEIPEYYIPQVYSNMCVIRPSTFGIYSEIIVVRCDIKDVRSGMNHTSSKKFGGINTDKTTILHNGVILIYCTPDIREYFMTKINGKNYMSDSLCDFGTCSKDLFYEMIQYWRGIGDKDTPGCPPKISVKYINVDDEIEYDENILGYCAWKCFDMSFHVVKKIDNYIENIWPIIEVCLYTLDKIKEVSSKEQKMLMLDIGETIINKVTNECYNNINEISSC